MYIVVVAYLTTKCMLRDQVDTVILTLNEVVVVSANMHYVHVNMYVLAVLILSSQRVQYKCTRLVM